MKKKKKKPQLKKTKRIRPVRQEAKHLGGETPAKRHSNEVSGVSSFSTRPLGSEKKSKSAKVEKTPGKYKHFQKILLNKRSDILSMVKQKEGDFTMGEIGDEADVASQTFEREMMFEMTNGERIILDDIEAAIRKIEKGDFGFCEDCRKKIPHERVCAMPWARYCIQCQSRTESPSHP